MKWVGLSLLYRYGSKVQEGQVTRAGSHSLQGLSRELAHGVYRTSEVPATACDTYMPHSHY